MKRILLAIITLLLLAGTASGQELVGPEKTVQGTLAVFGITDAQEVSWCLIPNDPTGCYQVDTASRKLYFASPVTGKYTIIAATNVDGKPQLLSKTFINGEDEIKPPPEPTPSPVPKPVVSLETWIITQTPILVKSKNFSQESQLVAGCFQQIVKRIDDGNIKTVQNARTQLQISLTASLAQASPTAVTEWMPFLAELSKRLETKLGTQIDNLSEVKKTLQTVADTMNLLDVPKTSVPAKTTIHGIDCPTCRPTGTSVKPFRYILSK